MTRPRRRPGVLRAFERSYRTALTKHIAGGGDHAAAARSGRRAARLGIPTLGLARIHDRAAAAYDGAQTGDGGVRIPARVEEFFAEAVAPLEEAHCGAAIARATSVRVSTALSRRTEQLAAERIRARKAAAEGRALRHEVAQAARRHADLEARSHAVEARMRLLSHRLLSAQEEERMRISRDLHDAIGQTLTGINVGLATLKQSAAADSRDMSEAIATTQRLVERSMKTVHQFAWELRPTLLDDLGLIPALRSYAKTFAARTGLKVSLAVPSKLDPLDVATNTALFRVAQGALSNVERHAHANRARLVIRVTSAAIRLEIRDDGRAFNVARMDRSRRNKHLGLLVMRERIEMVGGTFVINSVQGRGTTVRAEVPLASSTPAEPAESEATAGKKSGG